MASYSFSETELELECDPDPQVSNSISLFDSIMTPVFLPNFFHIPESILNLVPIHREIESPISYDRTVGPKAHHSSFDELTHVVMFTNNLVMFSFRSLTKILVSD